MSTVTIPPQVVDQAADWFVAMRDADTDAAERERFAEWLRASPTHVQAYLEIARLWGDSAHIAPGLDAAAAAAPGNVVLLREGTEIQRGASAPRGGRQVGRWHAAAASFVLACALGAGAWWLQAGRAPSFVSAAGEQRVLTLDDGSIVRLNSRSEVRVRMTRDLRRIDLVTGQALFDVAKDPGRPFIVRSGGVQVRAVGTQFDVYRRKTGTQVSVVEGRVAVNGAQAGPSQGGAVMLDAGEQVTVTRGGGIDRPDRPNVAAATSWLQQKLIFDGQPLGEVLEEFNRYSRVPIVLSDPQLAALNVNAVFLTTSPESVLRYIGRFEGIAVERSDGEIRIRRRD